jgi:hypothetical protein
MTLMRRGALLATPVVAMTLAISMAGCSGDDSPSDDTSGVIPSETVVSSESPNPGPTVAPDETPAPNSNAGGAGAGDVSATAAP